MQTKNYYTQLFEKYYVLAILMPDTNTSPVNSEKPYYVGVKLHEGDLYIEILKECYAESETGRQDMLLIAVPKEKISDSTRVLAYKLPTNIIYKPVTF